jgi:calcium permeable stress-gated cation channel
VPYANLFQCGFTAHRYLVGYVYVRTLSQTGGLLQIWLLRRLGTLLSLQPILLGLIFFSREFWIDGGVLVGVGAAVLVFVESYTHWKTKLPGRRSLSAITRDSLDAFANAEKHTNLQNADGESGSLVSSAKVPRARGSMASVLEMMSVTLAVMPSPSPQRGPVPLSTSLYVYSRI